MDINKYVGGKIREFRKKKKVSQAELGKFLGVNQNTVSGYEKGEWEVSNKNLFKLADYFGVKVSDFFPPTVVDDGELERALKHDKEGDLNASDIHLINKIIEKALSLEGHERKELLNSIKVAVEVFEKINK